MNLYELIERLERVAERIDMAEPGWDAEGPVVLLATLEAYPIAYQIVGVYDDVDANRVWVVEGLKDDKNPYDVPEQVWQGSP